MDEGLIVLYIAYLVALGYVWLRFIQGSKQWGWTQLSWSFGFGTILWGYTQFLLNVFEISTHGMRLYGWQALVLAFPVILNFALTRGSPAGAVGLALSRHKAGEGGAEGARAEGEGAWSWIKILSIALVGVAFLTAILHALAFPMHLWDSIVIYGFKAKIIFKEETFKTAAFLDPSVLHYSTDYPLLLPYLEAGFYRWLGHPDDRVIRILFAVYWMSWLGMVYEALAEHIRKDHAMLLAVFMASLPLFSNIFMGQAASGFADIPFGFYWTGFLLCGIKSIRIGPKAPWVLMPLLALGCIFTKNEGLPAVFVGWGLFFCAEERMKEWRPLLLAFLLLLPWWWVRHLLPHNAAHYARSLSSPLSLSLDRLKFIGVYFFTETVQLRSWGLFWPFVFLGILWPARFASFPKESKIILAAVGIQVCVYVYVYLTYPQNLDVLVPITFLRLLMHTIGPLIVAIGWRLQESGGIFGR